MTEKEKSTISLDELAKGTFLEELTMVGYIEPQAVFNGAKDVDLGEMTDLEKRLFSLKATYVKVVELLDAQIKDATPGGYHSLQCCKDLEVNRSAMNAIGFALGGILWTAIRARIKLPVGVNIGVRKGYQVVMFEEKNPLNDMLESIKKASGLHFIQVKI